MHIRFRAQRVQAKSKQANTQLGMHEHSARLTLAFQFTVDHVLDAWP